MNSAMKFLHAWVELQASAKTFQKQSPDANSFQLSSLLPSAPLGKGFSSVPLLGWIGKGVFMVTPPCLHPATQKKTVNVPPGIMLFMPLCLFFT